MDLMQDGEIRIPEIYYRQETFSILVDPFDGIPRTIAEIERLPGTSAAGGKAVAQSRDIFKGFAAVIAHSAGFAR